MRAFLFIVLITTGGISEHSLRGVEGDEQIANAVQRGVWVYIYNEKGSQIGSVAAKEGLVGYTSKSVSIRSGAWIYIYDARGRQTGAMPGGK